MTKHTHRIAIAGALALCAFVLGTPARADGDPMACVAEVQRVCTQMEDHIEDCLVARRSSFSAGCLQQLGALVTMAAQRTGPGACIDDVKRACAGATGAALQSCIMSRRSTFSPECQRVLAPAGGQR